MTAAAANFMPLSSLVILSDFYSDLNVPPRSYKWNESGKGIGLVLHTAIAMSIQFLHFKSRLPFPLGQYIGFWSRSL